jgi:hypothetical protein
MNGTQYEEAVTEIHAAINNGISSENAKMVWEAVQEMWAYYEDHVMDTLNVVDVVDVEDSDEE